MQLFGAVPRVYESATAWIESRFDVVVPESGELVQHALAWARQEGLKVRPDCSFVRAYMDKHPEYADMRLPL